MPLVREMMDSGPRHTRARGIDASIRRQRDAERMYDFGDEDVEFDSSTFYKPDQDDDQDLYEGDDDSYSIVCWVRKGRDRRFATSGSSSSK
ncbi:hypothetical protein OROHE_006084 [Orobanche hederae]